VGPVHGAGPGAGLHRIGSYSNPENERSTRALLGVGLRHEGVLRAWHRHGDRYLDVNVFGLLREEWAAGELAGVEVAVEGRVPPAFAAE
jgi:ribosomal-protein-alanine N-acetyltransferase